MNLNDFIEKANGLGVVTLESTQLREINGGTGDPVINKALTDYEITPEDAYIIWYYEPVRG